MIKSALSIICCGCFLATAALGEVSIKTIFTFSGTNGTNPEGTLVEGDDGNLYGTTRDTTVPAANYGFHWFGYGTVFRITTNGALTTLIRFNETNGAAPRAGLVVDQGGDLYGTTAGGGPKKLGTVFRLTPGGNLKTLISFGGTNGSTPVAGLLRRGDGTLFGTTVDGGMDYNRFARIPNIPHGWGTAFSITSSGTLKTLVFFDRTNGSRPSCRLTEGNDGSLYGTTTYGGLLPTNTLDIYSGNGLGTVFRILPNGSLRTMVVFNGTNGLAPNALIMNNSGDLFGSTGYGGKTYSVTNDPYYGPRIIQGFGTIFRIGKNGELKTLVQFDGQNGKHPGDLILGQDGNLYGFTSGGGAYDKGTLFRLTPNGTFQVLHSFSGVKDDEGISTLMQARDGTFYGTGVGSFLGGNESVYKCGRIFRLTINPLHTASHSQIR